MEELHRGGREPKEHLVADAVRRLTALARRRRDHYRTPMQMLLVGDDSRFYEATSHFTGLDATIAGLRKAGINAVYSTPARYATLQDP